MNIQIDKSELELYKDNIPCKCEHCNKIFGISKSDAYRVFKGTRNKRFCSKECSLESRFKLGNVQCNCKQCGKEFTRCISAVGKNNFCSHSCSAKFTNVLRASPPPKCIHCGNTTTRKYCSNSCQKSYEYKNNIKEWLNGNDIGYVGKTLQIKKYIRRFLLDEANHQCSKCKWNEIHISTKKCPLEINHIDGDASNCRYNNLEVLCPNCHSLTINFRALNKNSARKRRYNELA